MSRLYIKGELAWRHYLATATPTDDEVLAALATLEARGDVTSVPAPSPEPRYRPLFNEELAHAAEGREDER